MTSRIRPAGRRIAVIAGVFALASPGAFAAEGARPPAAAEGAGFGTLTFDAPARRPEGVAATLYPWTFFRYQAPAVQQGPDGTVGLAGGGPYNAQVATAAMTGPRQFVGIAFGGGGYFEATMSFEPDGAPALKSGWPAFWAMPIEHLAQMPEARWKGQTEGFEHFAELDVFEYNLHPIEHRAEVYGGSLIEWYGIWGQTCREIAGRFCSRQVRYRDKLRPVPAGTDFRQPHRYGVLWVPATPQSAGEMSWYFDGTRIGETQRWPWPASPETPPPDGLGFGVVDAAHLVFLAGSGTTMPARLHALRAWQRDATRNWVRP